MKRKYLLTRKLIVLATMVTTLLLMSLGTAFSAGSSSDTAMSQMMGESAFNQMQMMEEQMMGKETHQQMEALMNKMMSGTLTESEQKEMISIMQDAKTGPGAGNMMMRGMMDQMMKSHGYGSGQSMMDGNHSMMGSGQGMMNGQGSKGDGSGMMNGTQGMWNDGRGMMGSFGGVHSSIGFAIFCLITIILLWILMIAAIIYLFQMITRKPPQS